MSLLSVIDAFYRTRKIHSQDFRCPQASNCDAEASFYGMERQEVKASFIGSKYGSNGLPRLVFLSLDPGNNSYIPDPADLTATSIQKIHESEEGPQTPHWRATHLFTLRLFNEIGHFIPVRDEMFVKTGGTYQLRGKVHSRVVRPVLPYVCHVNSAKCGANGDGAMTQAPGGFFVKCREYTKEELVLLEPDIVITQGIAAAAVLNEMDPVSITATLSFTTNGYSNERIRIASIGNAGWGEVKRKVLWLKTTHPTARSGAFWKEGCTCGSRNCWCEYARAFAQFVRLIK